MAHRQFYRPPGASRPKIWRSFLPRHWLSALLSLAGIAFLLSAATVLWWSKDLPNPQQINERRVSESTKIFDRTGQHLLYEIGDVHRTVVPLDNISRYIRQATIAAEDNQFYDHYGLDFKGIIRGVILKPLTGQRAQGGSTITQQLIKNSILTPERTIQRKVKEAVLAIELEQRFSKDEILAMYLNDIPYGSQAYGVEAAAKKFFNKPAADVSLSQATLLAALPQAPTYYSPYGSHFEDLKRRQAYILQRMTDLQMITLEQADAAAKEELDFAVQSESIRAPHFIFYVKELLNEQFGERIVGEGGLNITTTLNADMQSLAEEALKKNAATINSFKASNAALAAVDPKTGDILAMVGSLDYFNEDIDGNVNVAIRHRSPGSSLKPFVYAAAFQKGFTPDTILIDAETDFGQGYKPKNYNLAEYGPVTMRTALANSLNIPAVKTLYLAGVKQTTDLAQSLGMTTLNDPDRYGLSLVLGGGEVRLLDEVSAYGVLANDGVRRPHRAILTVRKDNETILDATQNEAPGEQALEPQIARQITNILSDNNARALVFGVNSPLQLGPRPVAAKTGTTQEFRDGWVMGYTPSLAAGVWVGNNDNSPMNDKSAGARTAAPIWNTFMRSTLAGTPIEQFVKPEPLKDIPHGILRGELPELKAKFEPETNTVYGLDCPVAVGLPKTFKELHSLLFYVRGHNPLGPPPANAESDPQFDNWEAAVAAWRDKHNNKTKTDPNEVYYGPSLPEPLCTAGNSEDLPKVTIVEPNTTILRRSPTTVKVAIESAKPVQEVRWLLDNEVIANMSPDDSLQIDLTFPNNFQGRKTLVVMAITEDKLIGRAHRTFIINPDDSPPKITLHTPQSGQSLQPTSFPLIVKVTATDNNGIEAIDVLYTKDGQSGTQRIGKTSTLAPTAPNRYEVSWSDSPGPGAYAIFARAYDTTGNFTDSARHTVTIE